MKLILIEHADHVEVEIIEDFRRIHAYIFDSMKQAEAFCSGFHCAKSVINGLVQSLPLGYEKRKA